MHLGVLEELELEGIRPNLIVGCSSGAIVGALYARYPSAKHLEKILLDTTSEDFMEDNYWPHSRFAVKDGERFKAYLQKNLKGATFADLSVPLVVVATDLGDGKLIELHEGDLASAVQASGAIPGVLSLFKFLENTLLTGEPLIISPCKRLRNLILKLLLLLI
ncbi:MAG: patatin-like phospholipase family protein [Alphaproteobacteria bacterium]|nr:patatin-like phospholipase family protein [Alphaproteobacteria bacterium]